MKQIREGVILNKLLCIFTAFFMVITVQAQTNHLVTASNYSFDPFYLDILKGDTITWINIEGHHNVNGTQETYPDNPESFGNEVGEGWTYSHVFNTTGFYNYQCDPHVSFGMLGQVQVDELVDLTMIFKDMSPHTGQDFWLVLVDGKTGEELTRINTVAEDSFVIDIPEVRTGRPYFADFYSDLNGNGHYDAPPDDHAWRLSIDTVRKDTTVEFIHNTSFTDIQWQHRVNVHFSGMTPHIGQDFWLSVTDKGTGDELGRIRSVAEEEFTLGVSGIVTGRSYWVNFFADLNGNGVYDVPPTDHAWQLSLDDVNGDTTMEFTHNTDFTDIQWMYKLTILFSGMTPHLGQLFDLYLYDLDAEAYVDTIEIDPLSAADFQIVSYAIMPGTSYDIDFFADLNGNGQYDAPPDDHAWRLTLANVKGDTTLSFTHDTHFTDIFGTGEPEGIAKTLIQDGTELYPNPAVQNISLRNNAWRDGRVRVIFYNTGGQVVREEQVPLSGRDLILDISQLEPGLYLLQLKTGNKNSVIRFMKGD